MNKLIPIIILLTPTPATAAKYTGTSATLPISVKIVANCNVEPKRWCDERKKCCKEKK